MGRRVLIGISVALLWMGVASAQPTAGQAGSVDLTSNGARYGQCEVLEFPAANWSPSRTGNVCSLPASSAMTALGSIIGDAASELYQGTSPPGTCDVGEIFLETDQTIPSGNANAGFENFCTAANTWTPAGDVLSSGRSGGQTIRGDSAADGNLTLQSTSNADRGSIQIDPSFTPSDVTENLVTFGYSFSSASAFSVRGLTDTSSLTCTGTIHHAYRFMELNPSIVTGGTSCLVGTAYLLEASPTLSATSAGTLPTFHVLHITPTITATNVAANDTGVDNNVVSYAPTYSSTGASGSFTKGADGAVAYAPTLTTNNASGAITVTNSYGLKVTDAAHSGAGAETVTNQHGIWIDALGAAGASTNAFPIRLTEATSTNVGTVPASAVVMMATSGSPNRLTAINENQQRWDMGYATWTGTANGSLSTSATNFFPAWGAASPGATEGNFDQAAPGALHVFAMACAVTAAPNGSGKTRTFTLDKAAATATNVTCTITNAATTCTWCVAASGTPCTTTATSTEAITAGALLDIAASVANTPASAEASCTIWWTLDAF